MSTVNTVRATYAYKPWPISGKSPQHANIQIDSIVQPNERLTSNSMTASTVLMAISVHKRTRTPKFDIGPIWSRIVRLASLALVRRVTSRTTKRL